jgi:hypothetical protein
MNNFLGKNSGIRVKHILILQSCLGQETMVRFPEKLTLFAFHQTTFTHSRANVINRKLSDLVFALMAAQCKFMRNPLG